MVTKKNNPDYIKNPLTKGQSYIKINGNTHKLVEQLLQKHKNNIQKAYQEFRKKTIHKRKKYQQLSENVFCGKECNLANPRSFPVDSQKRCRAALSYARTSSDPQCIKKCALKKSLQHNWKCGSTLKK